MSYEPTLIINKDQLIKKRELLINSSKKDSIAAIFLLKNMDEQTSIEIGGINIFLCDTELTSFNATVRKLLTNLEVEYWEYL